MNTSKEVLGDTAKEGSSDRCLIEAYYNRQYDRLAKHEDQTLVFSNLIVTLSLASFAVGAMKSGDVTILSGVILPIAVILSNICAILFIRRSHSSSAIHVSKAKACMQRYAPGVSEIDAEHPWPRDCWYKKRHRIMMILHGLLAITCLISILISQHSSSSEDMDRHENETKTAISIIFD